MALSSIRGNMLRSVLTMLIIAFGIMAIVSTNTAVEALRGSLNESFSSLGANTFNIRNRASTTGFGHSRNKTVIYRNITYSEAKEFEKQYTYPSRISTTTNCSFTSILKYEDEKTNPNIVIIGGNENYLANTGLKIDKGRNFSINELNSGYPACLIGNEIAEKLFGKSKQDPLQNSLTIDNKKYKIVGVLAKAGSSMGFNPDRWCIISLTNARAEFVSENSSYALNIAVDDVNKLDAAIDEATGTMRNVRNLRAKDDNNFQITRSDSFAQKLGDQLKYLTGFSIIVGLITLLGASIGLMNIMLVSVTERTFEIGIRKALGAKSDSILQQFLIEAIAICQFGGLFGIFLGILIGNIVAVVLHTQFTIPWIWVIGAYFTCLLVGIIAGIVPARKAARLDPIESLRYE
jgi:putative ABC transport system permease protein